MDKNNYFIELQKYKDRLSIALKIAHVCIFEVDLQNQLYTFFENSEDIFGVPGDKILSEVQPFSKLEPDEYRKCASEYFSHPDDKPIIDEAFFRILRGEATSYQARMKAGNSEFIWCNIDVTPIINDGKPERMIGVITNIEKVKSQIEYLRKCSQTDSFTGLYLKKYVEERIKHILTHSFNETHCLMLIDIDNFKAVNDKFGHLIGDEVLKSISDCLKRTFRHNDLVGRFGGDEFIVFIRNITSRDKIIEKINKLKSVKDNSYGVTKSLGVAFYPDDAVTFEKLFKVADAALYREKQLKKSNKTK